STLEAQSTLVGGTGDDTLYGGKSVDVLQGGAGNDVLYYSDAPDQVSPDTYDGGADTDTLVIRGTDRTDVVNLNSGMLSINYRPINPPTPGIERVEVDGGGGNDIFSSDGSRFAAVKFLGEAGDDSFSVWGGVSELDGGNDNDRFSIGPGRHTITGGSGSNTL